MAGSAVIGQPPNNQDDFYIVRGLMRVMGLPDGVLDPAKGLQLPLKRPASDQYPLSYPNKGPGVIAALSVAIALVVLITGARLQLRFFRKDLHWGWEDIVIIPAALGVVTWLSLVIAMITYGGAGKHVYDVTYGEIHWFVRLAGIDQSIFWFTVGLIKVSITLFNRRLTGLTSYRWMIAHNVFLCLLVVYILTAFFLNLFTCKPALSQYGLIRYGALPSAPRCLDANSIGITLSIIHIAFDFMLLSVPLIVLWRIKMSATKKARIGFLFSVGAISCIGSVMRQFSQFHYSADLTWNMDIINWTTVDIFFAITAASLPILNSLVPRRWNFSSHSLPQIRSWGGHRDRPTRHSVRLGSEEKFQPPAPSCRMSQLKFHNESLLDQDSQETIRAVDSNTRSDGTAILPHLDFQRGASLEDDRDIEKYTYPCRPSAHSFEARWNAKTELQSPSRAHQPKWSLTSNSPKEEPVRLAKDG